MTREQAFVTAFYYLHIRDGNCPGAWYCGIGHRYLTVRQGYKA